MLCMSCVFMFLSLFIVALWSPAGTGLFVMFNCVLSLSSQVWYLIVSIPDLCRLSYLDQNVDLDMTEAFNKCNKYRHFRTLAH